MQTGEAPYRESKSRYRTSVPASGGPVFGAGRPYEAGVRVAGVGRNDQLSPPGAVAGAGHCDHGHGGARRAELCRLPVAAGPPVEDHVPPVGSGSGVRRGFLLLVNWRSERSERRRGGESGESGQKGKSGQSGAEAVRAVRAAQRAGICDTGRLY